jgi:hypothetical protein
MKKISFKNKEEFKSFVISEAKKYIHEGEKVEDKKIVKESVDTKERKTITPENVAELASKMKELNKNLKFTNPVISEAMSSDKKKIERDEDMSAYNKGKQIGYQNESEQDKWQRMLGYEVPSDEKR